MKLHTTFQTALDYEVKPDGVSYLVSPLRFFSHRFNRTFEAPKGFPTDRASAEVFGWKLIGKSERPWVAHDLLFATGEVGLLGAGIMLYDLLRAERNSKAAAIVFALFATFHPKAMKAYHSHRKGRSQAAKFMRELQNV